jgi:transcriptional regulator with XRE-family HTH domain
MAAPMSEAEAALMKHIGRRLRRRRAEVGYSIVDAALVVGKNYGRYERGELRMSVFQLWRAAEAIGVPMAYLFDGLPEQERHDETQRVRIGRRDFQGGRRITGIGRLTGYEYWLLRRFLNQITRDRVQAKGAPSRPRTPSSTRMSPRRRPTRDAHHVRAVCRVPAPLHLDGRADRLDQRRVLPAMHRSLDRVGAARGFPRSRVLVLARRDQGAEVRAPRPRSTAPRAAADGAAPAPRGMAHTAAGRGAWIASIRKRCSPGWSTTAARAASG